jgi:hypothetical protein
VFELALGEPHRLDVTKVGGTPYRPENLPWPERREHGPMTFLAKFRFTESKDHIGPFPGDILLVFVKDKDLDFYGEDPEYFHFEWHPLGLTELARKGAIEPAWIFANCFGVRHRSVAFQETEECAKILRPLIPKYFPDLESFVTETRIESLVHLNGWMKIGGTPPLGNVGVTDNRRMKFLASIPPIQPNFYAVYPWINRPEPVDFPLPADQVLEWSFDIAWINLFIDETGKVVARCETIV